MCGANVERHPSDTASLGVEPRRRPAMRTLSLRTRSLKTRAVTASTVAVASIWAVVIALELLRPVHLTNLGASAALETVITLCAIVAAGLLVGEFERDRRVRELLLLFALSALAVSDFVYSAAPAVTGARDLVSGGGARLGGTLIVALALAAAAATRPEATAGFRRRLVAVTTAVGAGVLVIGPPLAESLGASAADAGIGGAATHALALGVYTTAAVILGGAAIVFLASRRREHSRSGLLAGACLLLAAANLQYIAVPTVATDWVTPGDGLRLAAYALLLAGAYVRYVELRRDDAYAAICSERARIAADLHDGLAQDLACIAAQGQRLACQLSPDHPLMIAARQALTASRGVIADLTACAAPTTEAALRLIADELAHRFGLEVNVQVETDSAASLDDDLAPAQRENLIRIAREAIVNAALHGNARHVDVVLLRRGGTLLMRVSDDGRGIAEWQRPGFGLRTMTARAASLGGQLNARARVGGGTDLELLVL